MASNLPCFRISLSLSLLLSLSLSLQLNQPSSAAPAAATQLPNRLGIGFYSNTTTPAEEKTILASPSAAFQLRFGSVTGQPTSHSLGVVHAASGFSPWYTYRNGTLGQYDALAGEESCAVNFTMDGNLVLTVKTANLTSGTDNILIWESGTSGKAVVAMSLSDDGNLILMDARNKTVWQSFDYPLDSLLPGQHLHQGTQLTVIARNGYPQQGIIALRLQDDGLLATVEYYPPAEPYWQLRTLLNSSKPAQYAALTTNGSLAVFDAQDNVLVATHVGVTEESGLQRFNLETDGNFRVYHYSNTTLSWSTVAQFITEACRLPDDCGEYGICSPGQACACPPSFILLPTLNGCVPKRALQCNTSHSKEFVKVAYASYFAIPILGQGSSLANLTLEECRNECASDCDCRGFFFYAADNGQRRPCLTTNQLRTSAVSAEGVYSGYNYSYDLYIRVQGEAKFPLAIVLGVCVPAAVIGLVLATWKLVSFRESVAHAEEEECLLEALPGLPPRYSYSELSIATRKFSSKLGQGSFGSVYDGTLPNGSRVAVKQLESLGQGKKEFHAEVATIGTIRHLNLVRLSGFCLEKNHRLLVYEHMMLGSLDHLLFSSGAVQPLDWQRRQSIALDVARALAYLHEGCPECIIHCDVKPSNVLVDGNGLAKLSDFGLAKLLKRRDNRSAESVVNTNIRGTMGYMAPEWLHNVVTEKSDVYSYGVMLIEMITGKRNTEFQSVTYSARKGIVPSWAAACQNKAHLLDLLAPALQPDSTQEEKAQEMQHLLRVALLCIEEDPSLRPRMSNVVKMLEGGYLEDSLDNESSSDTLLLLNKRHCADNLHETSAVDNGQRATTTMAMVEESQWTKSCNENQRTTSTKNKKPWGTNSHDNEEQRVMLHAFDVATRGPNPMPCQAKEGWASYPDCKGKTIL